MQLLLVYYIVHVLPLWSRTWIEFIIHTLFFARFGTFCHLIRSGGKGEPTSLNSCHYQWNQSIYASIFTMLLSVLCVYSRCSAPQRKKERKSIEKRDIKILSLLIIPAMLLQSYLIAWKQMWQVNCKLLLAKTSRKCRPPHQNRIRILPSAPKVYPISVASTIDPLTNVTVLSFINHS